MMFVNIILLMKNIFPGYSHVGMNFGGDADAVVMGDGEIMVEDPGRWAGAWTTAQVGREGVEVSHMAMCQQKVVTRAIYIMRHLKDKEFRK